MGRDGVNCLVKLASEGIDAVRITEHGRRFSV